MSKRMIRVMIAGWGLACLWIPVGSMAQEQIKQIDCASAGNLASRAYLSIRAALLAGNIPAAMEGRRAFWAVEEHSRNCEDVRILAKTLEDNNLGREIPTNFGSSGTVGTGTGSPDFNATVIAIEALASSSSVGSSTGGAVTGSSGSSGASSSAGASSAANAYRVTVRMDDGTVQVVIQSNVPDFRSGDRVRLTQGTVVRP